MAEPTQAAQAPQKVQINAMGNDSARQRRVRTGWMKRSLKNIDAAMHALQQIDHPIRPVRKVLLQPFTEQVLEFQRQAQQDIGRAGRPGIAPTREHSPSWQTTSA